MFVPLVQLAAGLAKLVDGGDEDLADVLGQKGLQLLAGGHLNHVRHVGGVEGGGDLGVQVNAVHHDHDRGIAQAGVHPELLGGKNHEERLAAALEMPDESLFRIAFDHACDDLVGGEILLVTADDLDAPMLLVGGEQGEVLQDVEHHLGLKHALDRRLDVVQLPFLLIFDGAPGTPRLDGHPDRAIAKEPSFGGEGKGVRHEHRRHLALVDFVDLKRAVEPGHGAPGGGLGLADDNRQTVDQEDHVEPLFDGPGLVNELVGDHQLVAGRAGIHEADAHVLATGAERHGLLPAQPGHEVLVGPHQAVGLHGEKNGPQGINDFIGAVGLSLNGGIEADEGQPQPRFHHHVAGLAGDIAGGNILCGQWDGRQGIAAKRHKMRKKKGSVVGQAADCTVSPLP